MDSAHGPCHISRRGQGGGLRRLRERDQVPQRDEPQQEQDRPGGGPQRQRGQKEQQPQRPRLPRGGVGRNYGQDGKEDADCQHPGGQRAANETDQRTAALPVRLPFLRFNHHAAPLVPAIRPSPHLWDILHYCIILPRKKQRDIARIWPPPPPEAGAAKKVVFSCQTRYTIPKE